MPYGIEDQTLAEIEAFAVEIAAEAGKILGRHFGRSLKIEYKDKRESDPVTDADHESQSFLVEAITKRFPEHGILGEEDDEEKQEDTSPAPDFLWVLDPLDGTKNFLHGLPIYAEMSESETLGVDTPADLARGEEILAADPLTANYLSGTDG